LNIPFENYDPITKESGISKVLQFYRNFNTLLGMGKSVKLILKEMGINFEQFYSK